MTKLLIRTALLLQIGVTAWAGYLPAPDDPYWCYQDCILSDYSNHTQCVARCYGGHLNQVAEPQDNSNCQPKNAVKTEGAACCSWGGDIRWCMPGC